MELPAVVENQDRTLRWRSLMLDVDQQCLRVGNSVVSASQAEFGLMRLLISRRNLPMSKEFIMSTLFGSEHGRDLRQVDVFVARLRRALSAVGLAGIISTIAGRGYAVLDDLSGAAGSHEMQPHGFEAFALA